MAAAAAGRAAAAQAAAGCSRPTPARRSAEGAAVVERRDAEPSGERLTDVGEGVAAAERARRDAGAEGEHRDVLARMVGAAIRGVAPVIGGDDREIARA